MNEYKMEILINNQRGIEQLKKDFSHTFPYLKIEFYRRPHKRLELSSAENMIHGDHKIGSIRESKEVGKIFLNDAKTVIQIEEEFEKHFGLHVQIFRRSGDVWIETSLTDDWTLDMQNKEGFEMSKPFIRNTFQIDNPSNRK